MTDTDKWKKGFIKGLESRYKLLWVYICDDCDHAGVWEVELDIAALRLGVDRFDEAETLKAFEGKIQVLDRGTKWFIPSFIEFQYGELKEGHRVHNSVIRRLKSLTLYKGYINPFQRDKDKDKEKDKEKEKDKDKDKDKEKDKDIAQVLGAINEVMQTSYKVNKSNRKFIEARLNDGNTVDDLISVVKYQSAEWYKTEYEKHINPETLFRPTKFEKYLQNAKRQEASGKTPKDLYTSRDKRQGGSAFNELRKRIIADGSAQQPYPDHA